MSDALATKLRDFNNRLDDAEKVNYKLILGLAAGGLSPKFRENGAAVKTGPAFDTVGSCLAKLQPYSDRISDNGVAWRGRPEFLTEQLLADLQREAKETRRSAVDNKDHFLGCGAPVANKLSTSEELKSLVQRHAGEVQPTGIASFIFYDQLGHGLDPHIDTNIFALNVILMLEQSPALSNQTRQSSLVLFPPHKEPQRVSLEVGEMLIMFAGSIAHGREYIQEGEKVTILTFGFHPLVP